MRKKTHTAYSEQSHFGAFNCRYYLNNEVAKKNLVLAVHAGDAFRQSNHALQLSYGNTPRGLCSTRLVTLPQVLVFFHDVLCRLTIYLTNQITIKNNIVLGCISQIYVQKIQFTPKRQLYIQQLCSMLK